LLLNENQRQLKTEKKDKTSFLKGKQAVALMAKTKCFTSERDIYLEFNVLMQTGFHLTDETQL